MLSQLMGLSSWYYSSYSAPNPYASRIVLKKCLLQDLHHEYLFFLKPKHLFHLIGLLILIKSLNLINSSPLKKTGK